MDYQRLAEVIQKTVQEEVKKHSPHIRLATVVSASTKTVEAIIDGSVTAASIQKGCTCVAGDRIVILKEGTQFYAIARIGGG